MTNGPGGVLNNTSLDNGNLSTHGYTVEGSLPSNEDDDSSDDDSDDDASAVKILSRADPTQIVDFCYQFQGGAVYYSSIPLDFYLVGAGPNPPRDNMRFIYAPNVVAYGIDGACADDDFDDDDSEDDDSSD